MGNYKFNSNPIDLDIYINPCDSERAFKLLEESGWIWLINPVANYRGIRHYYFFTSLNTYHLHIYSGLRTGDSWLKNYYFPLDDFLLKNSFNDANNINILTNEAFHFIFNIRLLIKNSTLFGRLLYNISIEKYKKESNFIDYENINYSYFGYLENQLEQFLLEIKDINIRYNKFPDLLTCQRIIRVLKKYSIINIKTNYLRQIISFVLRASNKAFLKFNKVLNNDSKIIAIYGSDGSGKSTLVDNLVKRYSKYFPCYSAHLGKPFQSNKLFNYFYSKRNSFKNSKQKIIKNFNLINGFKSLILSLLRLSSAIYQVMRKLLGITIITDRWPSTVANSMDGPTIFENTNKSLIIDFFNFSNKLIYKIMPRADLVIVLDTDLNQLIYRNSKRNKPEKLEFIKSRYKLKKNSRPKSKRILYFKNNKKLRYAINDCLIICSKFINQQ